MNFKSFGFSQWSLFFFLLCFGVVAAIDLSQTAQNNAELRKCKADNTTLYQLQGLFGVQYICTPKVNTLAFKELKTKP